jgi:hypothetical protein
MRRATRKLLGLQLKMFLKLIAGGIVHPCGRQIPAGSDFELAPENTRCPPPYRVFGKY